MRLALVDHHLANFHADRFLALLRTTFADRGIEVVAHETDPSPGPDWCATNAVVRASSLTEAIAWADAILVLAPDNVETHRDFANVVLPARKPVVFDKLLAPDPGEARRIVADAAALGTPILSGSALACATELEDLLHGVDPADIEEVFARGFGQWHQYGVHTVALALRLAGPDVDRVREAGTRDSRLLVLDHPARRTTVECRAGTNAAQVLGWSCGIKVSGAWRTATITDRDGFYTGLLQRYLDFLGGNGDGASSADLLRQVDLLAASTTSLAADGAWIDLT